MKSYVYLFLLCFFIFRFDHISSSYAASKGIEHCIGLCKNNFQLFPKGSNFQSDCQRGCRYFFLIELKNSSLLNYTNSECLSSCEESYADIEKRNSCNVGCNLALESEEDILLDTIPFETIYRSIEAHGIIPLKELNETFESYIQYKKLFKQSTSLNFEERIGKWIEYTSKDNGVFKGFIVIFFVILAFLFLYFSSENSKIIEKNIEKNRYDNLPIYEPNLIVCETKLNVCEPNLSVHENKINNWEK